MTSPITIFVAQKIITMDPSLPEATAVAVKDGLIASVGTLETLKPWLDAYEHEIVDTFKDKFLLPGFIDAHMHPIFASVLFGVDWLPPYDWEFPSGMVKGVLGKDNYITGLKALHQGKEDPEEPLIAFGYHHLFHGEVWREDLDGISTTRPIIAWHRSFHEIRCNTPAVKWLNAEEGAQWDPHIDPDKGWLYETGLAWAFKTLNPVLFEPQKLDRNMKMASEMFKRGGLTTIVDAGAGLFSADMEWDAYTKTLTTEDKPFRSVIIPNDLTLRKQWGEDTFKRILELPGKYSDRLIIPKAVKSFADGAFISQLMQVLPPGYIDGHHGAWLVPPDQMKQMWEPYWQAGFDIHVHVNGDMGVQATLDVLQELMQEHPRFDHRFTLHHFGLSTQDQATRIAALGATVSANGYYLYYWGDKYAEYGLGYDRASQMIRLGSLARNGVKVSLHADTPMAPPKPLLAVYSVVTRKTAGGQVMSPAEALTLEQALRAITIDAAFQVRMDNQIGSISAGKKADFAVLEADPFEVDPDAIQDLPIWGTVFEGELFPVEK